MVNVIIGVIKFVMSMGIGSAVAAVIKTPEGATKLVKTSVRIGTGLISMYAADKIVEHVEKTRLEPIIKLFEKE
jgi:uncharacterized membrane protein